MDADGAILDPVGGLADLRAKVLRHVGPSFAADPIRVLRTARFAARFPGFSIAPQTMTQMAASTARGDLDGVTPERVWLELDKALGVDKPSPFFMVLRQCGALRRLLPEIDALFGVPQPPAHHPEGDSGVHTMMALDMAARLTGDRTIRFAALVHDVGKGSTPPAEWPRHLGHEVRGAAMVGPLVRRLAGPNAYGELGALVARWHITVVRAAELRPGTLLEVLEAADAFHRPERLEALLLACEADSRGRLGHEDDVFPPGGLAAPGAGGVRGGHRQATDRRRRRALAKIRRNPVPAPRQGYPRPVARIAGLTARCRHAGCAIRNDLYSFAGWDALLL